MAQYDEVMIRDVDALNARIYLDGYMYVGGENHIPGWRFFAPYFTKECEALVPEVGEAGIACYSQVFAERGEIDMVRYPVGFSPDGPMLAHKYWNRWQQGLQAIANRARNESWSGISRLWFLLEPLRLPRVVKKHGWLSQIPPHYGTSLDRLRAANSLRDLKR